MILNSPYREKIYHPQSDDDYEAIMRLIEWSAGTPEDLSPCMTFKHWLLRRCYLLESSISALTMISLMQLLGI